MTSIIACDEAINARSYTPGTLGTDAGAGISQAIEEAAATGKGLVVVGGGSYDLFTPIVPKSDVTVHVSPRATFYQKGAYGVENPADQYVGYFSWLGGRFRYQNPTGRMLDALLHLRCHSHCNIELRAEAYHDQIIAFIKPEQRVGFNNPVYNRYVLEADECGIGLYLQGLEANYTEYAGVGTGGAVPITSTFPVEWPGRAVQRFGLRRARGAP